MRPLSSFRSHEFRLSNTLYGHQLSAQLLRGLTPPPHLNAVRGFYETCRASSTLGQADESEANFRDDKNTFNDDLSPYLETAQDSNQRARLLLELVGPKKPLQIYQRSSPSASVYDEDGNTSLHSGPECTPELARMTKESLNIGRKLLRECRDMYIVRCTLRRLFDQCVTCTDIVRVFSIAIQHTIPARCLPSMSLNIIRALFRARETSADVQIYATYYALIKRLEMDGLPVDIQFFALCVKFAARSRHPEAMRKALWLYRSRNLALSSSVFRSIIAKFSIGRNGFGELRNGKWRRRDLLPVLFGFPGTRSGSPTGDIPDHHLASFLQRDDWNFLSAWVQILGHAQVKDVLFREWEIWHAQKHQFKHNNRHRDEHFVCYMLLAGDIHSAWRILDESKLDFWTLHPERRSRLLDDPEYLKISINALHNRESFEHAMIEKYARALDKIERRLGVVWVTDGKGGGWHRPALDMVSRWEELGTPPEECKRIHKLLGDRTANFPEIEAG